MKHIRIEDYDYDLPEDKIARYPLAERDNSRLLVSTGENLSEDRFYNLPEYLSPGDILVYNNSRVVKARLLMRKESGAMIEVFCLEPHLPIDFDRNFASTRPVRWKCLIGNLKKWKSGNVSLLFTHNEKQYTLTATRLEKSGESWIVEFGWNHGELAFSDVLSLAGRVPIPPYLERPDEPVDTLRYQTIYCNTDGSVAAPTAGLHFTERVLNGLTEKGVASASITLHVSAGTFRPVKSISIADHEMHTEHFYITPEELDSLKKGRVIAVGTTSLRTLESIYWIGVSIIERKFNPASGPYVSQWEPYRPHRDISAYDAICAVDAYIRSHPSGILEGRTSLIIVPGYRFRVVKGLITNFHQPRSTLLLLVAAFAGEKWKEMYKFAMENGFRFLSYGDSSLILP